VKCDQDSISVENSPFFLFPWQNFAIFQQRNWEILEINFLSSVNSTNYAPFLGSISPIFLHKKPKQKALDANPLLKIIIKKTTNKTNNQVYVHHW